MGAAGEQGENIPLDSVRYASGVRLGWVVNWFCFSHSGGRQMMKYEEGVIPMADDEHGNNYR